MSTEKTYVCKPDEIQRLCRLKGLSRKGLAYKAHIDVKTLRRILQGKPAEIHTIDKIAKQLGVNCSVIMVDADIGQTGSIQKDLSTTFSVNLSITGLINSPDQIPSLVKLTPQIVAALEAIGIKITGCINNTTLTDDEAKRTIVIVYGLLENGNPFWLFAAVRASKYQKFLIAQKDGSLDLYHFDEFGEVLVSGEGKCPPDDVVLRLAKMYETDPKTILNGFDETIVNGASPG